eukprot:1536092-Amphidinium_carterae.2
MPLDETNITVFAMVHIADSLAVELQSEETLKLTRASISHFECFVECSCMTETGFITSETLEAMAVNVPPSCKIRATVNTQCPELADKINS